MLGGEAEASSSNKNHAATYCNSFMASGLVMDVGRHCYAASQQ